MNLPIRPKTDAGRRKVAQAAVDCGSVVLAATAARVSRGTVDRWIVKFGSRAAPRPQPTIRHEAALCDNASSEDRDKIIGQLIDRTDALIDEMAAAEASGDIDAYNRLDSEIEDLLATLDEIDPDNMLTDAQLAQVALGN